MKDKQFWSVLVVVISLILAFMMVGSITGDAVFNSVVSEKTSFWERFKARFSPRQDNVQSVETDVQISKIENLILTDFYVLLGEFEGCENARGSLESAIKELNDKYIHSISNDNVNTFTIMCEDNIPLTYTFQEGKLSREFQGVTIPLN